MVRFCTYNTRGLGNFAKRKQLFTLLKYKGVDVIFLQETHGSDENMRFWRSQWGGNILFANGTSDSRGVLILFRRELDYKIDNTIVDPSGRFIITEMEIENCQFVLCNVYAPNSDTPQFFDEINEIIETYENRNIIYGGDFNFVIDNQMDRKISHHNNNKARDTFLKYAQDQELLDVWRELNPDKKQYSCCRPNSELPEWTKFSRLDMFFVSHGLFNGIRKCVMQTWYSLPLNMVRVIGNSTLPSFMKKNFCLELIW